MRARLLAAALACASAVQQPVVPSEFLVGLVYAAPPALPDAVVASDLTTLRRGGFNLLIVSDAASRDRLREAATAEQLTMRADAPPGEVRINVGSGVPAVADARLAFWQAITRGARVLVFSAPGSRVTQEIRALGETAGIVTRNQALFVPLRSRAAGVRSITGDGGAPVEVKFLESNEALVIVGMNHAAAPRRVTIAFDPDVPEAIWQNMESGTSVDFVMGKEGPVLEHTFAPRDALVLMVRKRYR
jgi:hypothetical protein